MSRLVGVLISVCQAVAFAHSRGIVHRDLKPANILVSWDGDIKIADFGIATLRRDRPADLVARPSTVRGTPSFMSPEQIRGEDLDQRSDLFALGLVIATTSISSASISDW